MATKIEQGVTMVGLGHRMNKLLRAELASSLLAHGARKVTLTREQENKYDINAIRVNIEGIDDPDDFAYLNAQTAEVLAPKMDDGTIDIESAMLTELFANDDNKTGNVDLVIWKLEAAD